MKIILIHNGGVSSRSLAVSLLAAEDAGDMEAYQELLRVPLLECTFVEMRKIESPDHVLEVSTVRKVTPRFMSVPKHYRDLEYPRTSKRAQLLRSASRRGAK